MYSLIFFIADAFTTGPNCDDASSGGPTRSAFVFSTTIGSPTSAPEPLRKLTTPGGIPASSSSAKNRHAIHGASDDGFRMMQLPVTTPADVMPAMMASGKFHGGMTPPTPSGTYTSAFSSDGIFVIGCSPPHRYASVA